MPLADYWEPACFFNLPFVHLLALAWLPPSPCSCVPIWHLYLCQLTQDFGSYESGDALQRVCKDFLSYDIQDAYETLDLNCKSPHSFLSKGQQSSEALFRVLCWFGSVEVIILRMKIYRTFRIFWDCPGLKTVEFKRVLELNCRV